MVYIVPKFENWAKRIPREKQRFITPISSVDKINKKRSPLFKYPKTNPKEEIKVVLIASF